MIAVIADDLTGAAEIAGIGLRHGLSVELVTGFPGTSAADLLIVSTDTRSGPESEAVIYTENMTRALEVIAPEMIYKKIDSVLRGHVVPEIHRQLTVSGRQRALIVPANPAMGRVIRQGTYFIHGTPVHQTGFVNDPDFPVSDASVLKMAGSAYATVKVKKPGTDLPLTGIIIGESEQIADLETWASQLDKETLPAGGSGFFTAILQAAGWHEQPETRQQYESKPSLYVCGSAFGNTQDRIAAVQLTYPFVRYLPGSLIASNEPDDRDINDYCEEIVQLLAGYGTAIMAVARGTVTSIGPAALRDRMAKVVKQVMAMVLVGELFLEGGSTASAVLREIGIDRLIPLCELAPGVIRMREAGEKELQVILKPGSYDWPAEAWNFASP